MTTFPRGHSAYLARLEHLKKFPNPEPDATPTQAQTTHFEFPDPVDLRGIPAVGRGIAGVIPGTNPERIYR